MARTTEAAPSAAAAGRSFFQDAWRQALIAATLAVGAALLARVVLQIITPAELFAESLVRYIPLPIFSWLLGTFGPGAKHLFFGVVLIGAGIVAAATGLLYCELRALALRRWRPNIYDATESHVPVYTEIPLLVLLLWLVTAGVLAPLVGGGFLGGGFAEGIPGTFLTQLIPDVAFAVAFIWLLRSTLLLAPAIGASDEAREAAMRLSRRRLLNRGLTAVLAVSGVAIAWEFISSSLGISTTSRPPLNTGNTPQRIVPPPQPTYGPWTTLDGQTPEVTSPTNFYYVSKNLVSDPQVDAKTWKLSITGSVNKPMTLSYDDLKALPVTERYHTLECISNEVGGDLMSNGLFRGTSLANLLNMAGIQTGANEMIFRAADDYSDRLHLSQALDPLSLIVYELDGAPLPQAHGYPARLLIPGLYGMKNGKWLTSLEVNSGDYTGYWEQQGWTREAHVKMTSRIDLPSSSAVLTTKPTWIAGVAYAANHGISRVEVTTDSGATWQPATLRRPLGALTWVLWQYHWQQPTAGSHILAVRAIDLDGNVQTPNQAPPLPDGSSGYDAIQVLVG